MVFHLREFYPGTILFQGNKIEKLNTKAGKMFGNAAFPYWHPSKKYIAFSVNRVNQIFHAIGTFRAAAIDMKSDIFVYDIENNKMLSSPVLSAAGKFETFPCFSPDGLKLYYCSADSVKMPQKFDKTRYSLCSVSFNPLTGEFGEKADTLISGPAINKSISIPRVSPDGRFLIFCMADYGAFPSYNPEANLYLLDLNSRKYKPLEILNSNSVESWHSWSSTGRWIVFSSRRGNGLYSDVYIAFMDENGNAGKPFLLPQKDPNFYDTFLFSYNVPELVKSKVLIDPYQVEKIARKTPAVQVMSESGH
jgi:Tol biopolymer transport system component